LYLYFCLYYQILSYLFNIISFCLIRHCVLTNRYQSFIFLGRQWFINHCVKYVSRVRCPVWSPWFESKADQYEGQGTPDWRHMDCRSWMSEAKSLLPLPSHTYIIIYILYLGRTSLKLPLYIWFQRKKNIAQK